MKYYIIAGEASGDLHGSNLVKQIHLLDPHADIRCWGGDLMQKAGATLVKHYRELAFMGFAEVIKNLPTILRNIGFCKKDILAFKPDVLVLIDYPGFNLRIAKWARLQNIKVAYYISPQVWAWKSGRVHMMKKCIDLMMVILPFEKEYFAEKWQWPVHYVGHPLVKVIEAFKPSPIAFLPHKKIVAVLPGSRKQEISVKLPEMLKASIRFPECQFVVAKAPGIDDDFYAPMLQPYDNVTALGNQTYSILKNAEAAIVTSGTATLETALFRVPELVCYKGSPISYQIAKRLIKIKYISLVNLIMDKPVVKELIQDEMNSEKIAAVLKELLYDETCKKKMQDDYAELSRLLQSEGDPSAKAAGLILQLLQKKS